MFGEHSSEAHLFEIYCSTLGKLAWNNDKAQE